jgi:hypothetical protein
MLLAISLYAMHNFVNSFLSLIVGIGKILGIKFALNQHGFYSPQLAAIKLTRAFNEYTPPLAAGVG